MQSNNGDLYFRAGIDLDGFNADANAMERRMGNLTSTVVHDAGQMDDAISKIGGTFTKIVSAAAAAGFVKEMVNVRAEIQALEVSFKTLLGSEEKAMKMMGEIRKFAANTPMQMNDLAGAAQTLLAFNYDAEKLMPTLKALGDVSMGDSQRFKSLSLAFAQMSSAGKLMGQDLLQMINAGFNPLAVISEKTGKSISTLKDEMAKGKISADMVTQAFIDATSEGGKFYNMLEQQSKTVGGALSNVQGALQDMFNELGEKSEGVVYNSILGVQKLIQNYQEVAKVLGTLVVAYGAARAARIAMNVAQQNGTGITVLDNTVWSIRAKLLKNELVADTNVTRSIRVLRKEQEAEIATLKAQLTTEQNDLVIKRSRIANINTLLTAEQRQRLSNIGVTESHKDYIAIATSMLTTDQRVALAKAELTNNTTAYIAALRQELAAQTPNLEAMRQGVKAAAQEAEALTATAIAKQKKLLAAKKELAAAIAEGNQKKINIAQTKVENLTEETSIARKKALAAQRKKNAAQAELEAAAKKKSTVAGEAEIVVDNAMTKSKGLLAVATGKLRKAIELLWTAIKANPIGWLIGAVSAVVILFQRLKSKAEKAAEAEEELRQHEKSLREESERMSAQLEVEVKRIKEFNGKKDDEKKLIKELNDKYGEIFGRYDTLAKWYDTLTQKASVYVDMLYKQRLIEDNIAKAGDLNNLIKEMEKNPFKDKGFWESGWAGMQAGIASLNSWVDAFMRTGSISEANYWSNQAEQAELNKRYYDPAFAAIEAKKKERDALLEEAAKLRKEMDETLAKYNINLDGTSGSTGNAGDLTDEQKRKLKKMQEERAKILAEMNSREAEILEAQANIMEDGVQRRLMLIEAAYKKTIGQIERDELEARKRFEEAGMDYENSEEGRQQQSVFEARRKEAEHTREEEQKKATDGLVDYMKGKYEEYQKWVNMMGEDVANKQYSALISQGATFSQWVDQQIAALQSKEDLTAQEMNYLFDLMGAKEENAKKFYSSFLSGVMDEANKAPDAAAKLAILTKALNDLSHVKDKSQAISDVKLQIAQMITDLQKDLEKAFTAKYVNYVTERQRQVESYRKEIEKLRNTGKTEQANALEQAMKNSIGEFDKDFIKSFLHDVFGSNQTRKGIKDAYKQLEKMRKAVADSLKTGNTNTDELAAFGLTGLSLDDLKELLDRIRDVKNEVENVDTQSGLAVALRNIRDGLKENDVTKLKNGMDYITDAYSKFTQVVSALSDALNSLADATDDENLKKTAKTVSSVSNVLTTGGSWAAMGASIGGGWGAAIGGVVGLALGTITEIFGSKAEEEAAEKQRIDESIAYMSEISEGISNIYDSVASMGKTITSLDYKNYRQAMLEFFNTMNENKFDADESAHSWRDSMNNNGFGANSESGVWNSLYYFNPDGTPNASFNQLLAASEQYTGMYEQYMQQAEQYAQRAEEYRRQGNSYLANYYNVQAERYRQLAQRNGNGYNPYANIIESLQNNYGDAAWWLRDLMYQRAGGSGDPFAGGLEHISDEIFNQIYEGALRILAERGPEGNRHGNAYSIGNGVAWSIVQYIKGQYEALEALKASFEEMYQKNPYDSLQLFNMNQEALDIQKNILEAEYLAAKLAGNEEEAAKYLRMIRELEFEQMQSLQEMVEGLWGTDIQSILEEWISIFEEFGDNVEGAFAKIDEGIDRMIANAILKRKVIEPMLNEMMKIFEGFEGDLTNDDIERMAREVGMRKEEFYERYQNYLQLLEQAGINLSDLNNEDTMTGSLQNLSEETGGVIAGRLNAMVINQAEGNNVLRQSLLVQHEMNNHLAVLEADVATIKHNLGFFAPAFNQNMNYGHAEL